MQKVRDFGALSPERDIWITSSTQVSEIYLEEEVARIRDGKELKDVAFSTYNRAEAQMNLQPMTTWIRILQVQTWHNTGMKKKKDEGVGRLL